VPTESLLLQFDYLPVLDILDERTCVAGLAPTHAAIGFTDSYGQKFRAVCPPAMVSIGWSEESLQQYGDVKTALVKTALAWSAPDIIHKIMFDFSHRPLTVLRGIWLAARGQEPPGLVTYLRRLAVAIERGQECLVHACPHLDAASVIRQQIEIATHYNDLDRLAKIEKGIAVLREALELDAKTALSVLDGEKHDFERERIETGGAEIQTPFGRGAVIDTSRLVRPTYEDWEGKLATGHEVELTDDLLDGMGV
jgi:hypothetical protein